MEAHLCGEPYPQTVTPRETCSLDDLDEGIEDRRDDGETRFLTLESQSEAKGQIRTILDQVTDRQREFLVVLLSQDDTDKAAASRLLGIKPATGRYMWHQIKCRAQTRSEQETNGGTIQDAA
jgi:hypothetical protein